MRSIRSTQPQLVLEINPQAGCLSLSYSEAGTQRLCFYNAGFLRQRQLRRILSLTSYKLCIGHPKAEHVVVVWGHSPTAYRGQWVAQKQGASLIRIEDAFEPTTAPSVTDYVLVIDQTFNDAALRTSGANAAPFHQMLAAAKRDYPDSKILIKAHAETISGHHLVISAPPMKPMMFRFCPSQHPLGGCLKAQKQSIRILPKWALKPS